jgi:hypothetical protein
MAAGVWSHNAWEKGRLAFMGRDVTQHRYDLASIFHPDHVNVYGFFLVFHLLNVGFI